MGEGGGSELEGLLTKKVGVSRSGGGDLHTTVTGYPRGCKKIAAKRLSESAGSVTCALIDTLRVLSLMGEDR